VDCSETTSSEDFGNGLLVREDSGSYFANQPEKSKDDVSYTSMLCIYLGKLAGSYITSLTLYLTQIHIYIYIYFTGLDHFGVVYKTLKINFSISLPFRDPQGFPISVRPDPQGPSVLLIVVELPTWLLQRI
jgi:hypothetical protein